jgi:glycosyltransferase involved in cell wall biosynthesis
VLLHALTSLPETIRLIVAGDGHDGAQLRRQAQTLGIADRVTFLGAVDRSAMESLYLSAAVVAVPSVWPEPLGMVGLEAMSYARPVVGSAVGGITDWLSDEVTGLACEPGDVDALRRRLQRLLDDSDLRDRLGAAGREAVAARFTFGTHVDRLLTVFDGVMAHA